MIQRYSIVQVSANSCSNNQLADTTCSLEGDAEIQHITIISNALCIYSYDDSKNNLSNIAVLWLPQNKMYDFCWESQIVSSPHGHGLQEATSMSRLEI